MNPRFIVQRTLSGLRSVSVVGIEARSEQEALEKAERLLANGTFWDNTNEHPLLSHLTEEDQGDVSLTVTPLTPGASWPEQHASAQQSTHTELAFAAAQALVSAYQEARGSIDWSDLDEAYQLALQALGQEHKECQDDEVLDQDDPAATL